MAEVPYQPFSTAQPITPGEKVTVDTPGAAFGVNIGEATQRLGGSLEQAGGEVFQRAVAMQQLANETVARDNVAEYAKQQGEMHANFIADNPGLTARQNLPAFYKQSDDLRKSFRAQLPNDEARRMYDAESTGFFIRNVNSAALHAGQAFSAGVLRSAKDADYVNANTWARPGDPTELAEKQAFTERNSHTIIGLEGGSEVSRQAYVLKQNEYLKVNQLTTLGQTNPLAALDDLTKNPTAVGEAFPALREHLWQENERITGSRVAQGLINKYPDASEKELLDKIPSAVKGLDKGDEKFQLSVENHVRLLLGHQRTQEIYDKAHARDFMTNVIANAGGNATAATLLSNPEVARQAKVAGWTTDTVDAHLRKHYGLIGHGFYDNFASQYDSFKGASYEDQQKFMSADFWDPQYHMSPGEIKTLTQARRSLVAGSPINYPQVRAIANYVQNNFGQDLVPLGIMQKHPNGTLGPGKNWNAMVGQISTAVEQFEDANQRPMSLYTDKKLIEEQIIPALLSKQASGHWWKADRPTVLGPPQSEIDKETAKYASEAKAAGRPAPTASEVARKINQERWKDLIQKGQPSAGTKQ